MKASQRIVNAVIYGGNQNFNLDGTFRLPQHPLSKNRCTCGEWIREKDRTAHLAMEHDERPRLPAPSDEEIDAMYEASQTESEAYRLAH